jgi:hypothetical protein
VNKRPGHVDVATEVGYCNFCQRTRNLRSEAHHLGTFVRTIVTCESCHRTLSSTIGVAQAEEAKPEPEPAKEEAPAEAGKAARPKRAPSKRAAAAAKAKTPARRTSTTKK